MAQRIFFSWQSDTPARISRSFLKLVLEEVCEGISTDTDIDEAFRTLQVDSDTQGVAGQPPIVDTIFKKIDTAAVFVADLTFIGTQNDGNPISNPNVLIEYGWALKTLGHGRVIYVMNTAYGAPTEQNLPFDLRYARWPIQYKLSESDTAETKAAVKKELAKTLNSAIRASLSTVPNQPAVSKPHFPAAVALNGPARFRKKGEALGFNHDIFSGSTQEVFLSDGPAIWLRLMPEKDTGKRWAAHDLKNFATQNSQLTLRTLPDGTGGYDFVSAEDGFGIYQVTEPSRGKATYHTGSSAFVFATGEIWSIDTLLLKYSDNKLFLMEDYFKKALQNYATFLQNLGLNFPFVWIAGINGIKKRNFNYPPPPGHQWIGSGPICLTDLIEVRGEYKEGESTTAALMPFFKKIFEKCGRERPDHLPQ